jgi:hypothetical protein
VATFTLTGDINELTGEDASRVTVIKITPSHRITDAGTGVLYPRTIEVPAAAGEFSALLPSDATPAGYQFIVEAPQAGLRWVVPKGATGSTADVSDYA